MSFFQLCYPNICLKWTEMSLTFRLIWIIIYTLWCCYKNNTKCGACFNTWLASCLLIATSTGNQTRLLCQTQFEWQHVAKSCGAETWLRKHESVNHWDICFWWNMGTKHYRQNVEGTFISQHMWRCFPTLVFRGQMRPHSMRTTVGTADPFITSRPRWDTPL